MVYYTTPVIVSYPISGGGYLDLEYLEDLVLEYRVVYFTC
jgi:hypothetical protein